MQSPAKLVPEVPTIARSRALKDDPFDRLWRLLCSVRFAILLITLAAGGVLIGTLIMQAPADVLRSQETFEAWLARPLNRYGQPWHSLFAALDFYRVFSAAWWRGLMAVLVLAVVVCTVNRMPGIVASVRRPAVKVPARLFDRAPLRAEFEYSGVSAEQAQLQVAKVCASRRYRVLPTQEGPVSSVFADKNRFGKLGTFLNHIGIITILGAAVLGNVLGWRENAFMVPEGSSRTLGRDTGIVVRNDGFTDEYYPSGTPKDYRTDLVLLQDGQEVVRKTIRVNDPLDYNGIRFHQAFFGPAVVMRVTDAEGRVAFEDGVALGYQFDGTGITRHGGFFILGNRRMAVYVLVPAAQRGPDPEIPAGSVRLEIFEPRQTRPSAIETLPQGTPQEILGYTFEFVRERQFSGLQVVHNPAINLIWLACGMMLVGALAVFNFPLRRVWARAEPLGADRPGVRLRLAAVGNRDVLFTREFEALALAIDRQIAGLLATTAAAPAPSGSEAPPAPAGAARAERRPAAAPPGRGPARAARTGDRTADQLKR
ncbi:MAG TPA: cytochrome c biogenesis protein ResB [Chloroflexota bacterium]|nr:cytochrome c biogenesis protein ResB [Chloroflexota bacterium]